MSTFSDRVLTLPVLVTFAGIGAAMRPGREKPVRSETTMTFQHSDGNGSAIARLPNTMTKGQEFLRLITLRRQIDARLYTLADMLDGEPCELPQSGLVQVAPGVFLFKEGCNA